MQISTEQRVSYWRWGALCLHGWRIYFGFPASSSASSKMWEVPVLVQFPLDGCLAASGPLPVHSHLLLNWHSGFHSFTGTDLTVQPVCSCTPPGELCVGSLDEGFNPPWSLSQHYLTMCHSQHPESHIRVSYSLFMFTCIFKQSSSTFSFT